MADTFPRIPFQEAVDALERRGTRLFPSDHWATVWQEQHHTGFTVARSAGFDILDDIYKATLTREKSGMTFHQFKKELIPVLQQKGWWGTVMQADPARKTARNSFRAGASIWRWGRRLQYCRAPVRTPVYNGL